MSTKDWWIVIAMVLVSILFLGSLLAFVVWDNENDKRVFKENCADIAKTFNVKEYHVDGYDCYIIKDNKIKEIKL